MTAKTQRNTRRSGQPAKLSMSAMIDVVFLLLVFFVIVTRPQDILAGLEVSRPQAEPIPKTPEKVTLIRIAVDPDGYLVNGKRMSLARIDSCLEGIAKYSTTTTIAIVSTGDASHSSLVKLLNICEKWELEDLCLFSM